MTMTLKDMVESVSTAMGLQQTVKADVGAAIHLPRDLALLVIDVQGYFCDPDTGWSGTEETVKKAELIKSIVPAFRKAGVKVYAIYYKDMDEALRDDRKQDFDFYKFKPEPDDIRVPKTGCSAFTSSKIDLILRRNGHKSLLACGFYTSACVSGTVLDARKRGYNITLLDDLTGDYNNSKLTAPSLQEMRKAGVEITSSAHVLQTLKIPLLRQVA